MDRQALTADDDGPESMGWNHWTEGAPRGDILIPDDSALDLQQLSDTLVHEAVHGFCPRLNPGESYHGETFAAVAESFVTAMATRRPCPGVPMTIGRGEQCADWPTITTAQRAVMEAQFSSRQWLRTAGHASIHAGAGR